jgi:hypothetical protein
MQRYLAQTPQEDAGTYARLVRAVDDILKDKHLASCHCLLAQKERSQLGRPPVEADCFLISSRLSTRCPLTGSGNISWVQHAYFGKFELEFHIHFAYGRFVLLVDNPHAKSAEILCASRQSQSPESMPCLDSKYCMEILDTDALEQRLCHINTHLEQFIARCDLQIICRASKGNTRPVNSTDNSYSMITYQHEILRRLILRILFREILWRSTLAEDLGNGNLIENYQKFSLISPSILSYNPQTARGNLTSKLMMNYGHSNHDYIERKLPLPLFARETADNLNNHLRMEQQNQEDSTISEYSSSLSSHPLEDIFSLENSSVTDTNSDSIFPRGDNEEADLYNAMAEQVSHSDLVNEFARFTLSWLVAWIASRKNRMSSNV